MQPVTDFTLVSDTLVNDSPTLVFAFSKPVGVSGYILYLSSTGSVYAPVSIKSDISMGKILDNSTRDIDGKTQFTYVMPLVYPKGQAYYFKILAVDIYNSYSAFSDVLSIVVPCSKPQSAIIAFDNYEVDLSWSSNMQPEFSTYEVHRYTLDQVKDNISLTGSIVYNDMFLLGMYTVIYDNYLNSQYEGFITVAGQFDLNGSVITGCSDVSTVVSSVYSYDCYMLGALDTTWVTTSTGLLDSTIKSPTKYAYAIYNVNSIGAYSVPLYKHIKTQKLASIYPVIRTPSNSSTGILSDAIWPTIKNSLIGSNYYNQTTWAIPYSQTTAYNLRGICWVSECSVDLFINDVYNSTVLTDAFGTFSFNYKFPRGNTLLRVQVRDKINIQFSQPSISIQVQTLNMYTWFYAIGTQFSQIMSGVKYLFNGLSISTASAAQFADNYQPLVGLVQDASEDPVLFHNLATGILNSFAYIGYTQGLKGILDAFKSYDSNILNYEIYPNNSFYTSNMTPDVYVDRQLLLPRNRYTYAITALKDSLGNIEETTGTEHIVDTRWTPSGIPYMNVVKWLPVVNAENYRIYRKANYVITSTGYVSSSTGFVHLIDTPKLLKKLVFADIGLLPTIDNKVRPLYNFSTLDEVPSVNHVAHINTSFYKNESLKKTHFVSIILYMEGATWPSNLTLKRLFIYLPKMIPPEDNYTIIICNNVQSILYDAAGNIL